MLAADVAGDLGELLGRDQDFVAVAVLELEVVAGDAGDRPGVEAGEPGDAVVLVDHVLAGGARFYTWSFYTAHDVFKRLKIPHVLKPAIAPLVGEVIPANTVAKPMPVFPRPPTMCASCPHLGVYYTLSQLRNAAISGDIGCYTLGFGKPWNALDACISMGASMGMALGMDKGRAESEKDKKIVAVIGDSTFMHMGMQGLLDIVYNRGNVTVMILDNRTVGMTGGQNNPANGRDIHGNEAPRIDFEALVKALGVKDERVHVVDSYELPTLFKVLRQETKIPEPSVIITRRPCVLIEDFKPRSPLTVIEDKCTGCGNCVEIGCPAIRVTRRDTVTKANGKEVGRTFVRIDSIACTGCNLCTTPCAPDAIVPIADDATINLAPAR